MIMFVRYTAKRVTSAAKLTRYYSAGVREREYIYAFTRKSLYVALT